MKLGILLLMIASITQSTAPKLVFPQPTMPNGEVGIPYIYTLTASGGVPPYKWMDDNPGTLPDGLTLGQATGTISRNANHNRDFQPAYPGGQSEKPAQRVQRNIPFAVGVRPIPAD